VCLLATRAWAQGGENALGFMLDLVTGGLVFSVLVIVGVVTLVRNSPGSRRPVSITLGVFVGLVKLGWALRVARALLRDTLWNQSPYYHGPTPWDFMMGAFIVLLVGLGGFELYRAVKAMAPAASAVREPAGQRPR
jgi:hypothetical protein